MKNTIKFMLVVCLLSSIAFADGDMGGGTKHCGDLGGGTKCSITPVNEKEPISIKGENEENSRNIIIKWFDDIFEEIFN